MTTQVPPRPSSASPELGGRVAPDAHEEVEHGNTGTSSSVNAGDLQVNVDYRDNSRKSGSPLLLGWKPGRRVRAVAKVFGVNVKSRNAITAGAHGSPGLTATPMGVRPATTGGRAHALMNSVDLGDGDGHDFDENERVDLTGITGAQKAKSLHMFRNMNIQMKAIRILRRVRNKLGKRGADKSWTVADFFEYRRSRSPNQVIIMDEAGQMTFDELDKASNRVANFFHSEGARAGTIVGLLMENRIEFVIAWLGLAKIGVTIALLNTTLRAETLLAAMSTSKATVFIYGTEMSKNVKEAASIHHNKGDGTKYRWLSMGCRGEEEGDIEVAMSRSSDVKVDPAVRHGLGPSSPLFYIYTSGTTGMPKAAKIKHLRFYGGGCAFSELGRLKKSDRIYCPLPMYHSSALLIGLGCSWYMSIPFCLRRKFSARNFFSDCKKYGATVIQYIGEICRYLNMVPESSIDRDHNVRIAIGNGMRPDVWTKFVSRFNIAEVMEFYASTEGNVILFNPLSKVGAVGYMPPIIQKLLPVKIVQFDENTEMPKRDRHGRCVVCGHNEPGEILCEISARDPLRNFDGYTNSQATEKKILRDVFKPGDAWFRSGDLLRKDADGYYYFVDRIGDTFRWKGENVSTTEVSHVVDSAMVLDSPCNVYGVEVPEMEGRVGMTAIVPSQSMSIDAVLAKIYSITETNLAAYQRPYFLRVVGAVDLTGTSKLKKVELVKEGFDVNKVKEPLYYRDSKAKKYVPLTPELYAQVCDPSNKML